MIILRKQSLLQQGACDGVSRPPNFMKYLEAILAFTQHPSQVNIVKEYSTAII